MVSSVRSVCCEGGGQRSFIVVTVSAVWLVLKELSKGPILSVQYVDKKWPALCVYMTPDSISDYFVAHMIYTFMTLCSTHVVQIRFSYNLLALKFATCHHVIACNLVKDVENEFRQRGAQSYLNIGYQCGVNIIISFCGSGLSYSAGNCQGWVWTAGEYIRCEFCTDWRRCPVHLLWKETRHQCGIMSIFLVVTWLLCCKESNVVN